MDTQERKASVCMDCCEAPATVADLYCDACIQVMADAEEFTQARASREPQGKDA